MVSGSAKILSLPPELIRIILRAVGGEAPQINSGRTGVRLVSLHAASLVRSSWTMIAQEEAIRAICRDLLAKVDSSLVIDFGYPNTGGRVYEGLLNKLEKCPTLARAVERILLLGQGQVDMRRRWLRVCVRVSRVRIRSDSLDELSWDDVCRSPALKTLSLYDWHPVRLAPCAFDAPGLRSITEIDVCHTPQFTKSASLQGVLEGIDSTSDRSELALFAHMPSFTSLSWPEPPSWPDEMVIALLSPGMARLSSLKLLEGDRDDYSPSTAVVCDYWKALLPAAANLARLKISWYHYLCGPNWTTFIDSLPESCTIKELTIYAPYMDHDEVDVHVTYSATCAQLAIDMERAAFRNLAVLTLTNYDRTWNSSVFNYDDSITQEELDIEMRGKDEIEALCRQNQVQLVFLDTPLGES